MANRKTRCATREAAVGNQSTSLVQVLRLEVRGRVEHLLHTRTSLGALVADNDNVASLHRAIQNAVHSLLLRLKYLCLTTELHQLLRYASSLHDATLAGDVASEHCQASVAEVGVVEVADATLCVVGVHLLIVCCLRTHLAAIAVGGCAEVNLAGIVGEVLRAIIVLVQSICQ